MKTKKAKACSEDLRRFVSGEGEVTVTDAQGRYVAGRRPDADYDNHLNARIEQAKQALGRGKGHASA